LADVHVDRDHHRSVFTLLGGSAAVVDAALSLAVTAIELIDLRAHRGAHPRFGVLDVVPFTPVGHATMGDAIAAREHTIERLGALGVPCFRYGPLPDGTVRSLPEVRRAAFKGLDPDRGSADPSPRVGACAVGARGPLVAWNVWLQGATLAATSAIARSIRSDAVRALGFEVAGATQVSCNLLEPTRVTPKDVYLLVEQRLADGAHVVRCELVGLVGDDVLDATPESWWERLDLSVDRTVGTSAARIGLALG
jgi:glutamate formiminotransferase